MQKFNRREALQGISQRSPVDEWLVVVYSSPTINKIVLKNVRGSIILNPGPR